MQNYYEFLKTKEHQNPYHGIEVQDSDIHPMLYDFQKTILKWACLKARAAVFADCGLGKTFIQLEWARLIGGSTLVIAPLCVTKQTIQEAKRIDLPVHFVRRSSEIHTGINITNYEMIENFNADMFHAVVLDESSILKSLSGKTRKKLIRLFENTPFKLCCTATPCPNDIAELGNHAEFLGILTHAEMLASFFVNKADKGQGWVMKGHAHDAFYKWLASWAVCLTTPEDLGFDGSMFILPPLNINHIEIPVIYRREGELFFTELKGIQDRANIRKQTVNQRIKVAVEKITKQNNENQWVCWCGLNDEANRLQSLLGDIAINVQGSDSVEQKEAAIWSFLNGQKQVLITKPKIAGYGMNFQNANNMIFIGLSDSYESYYQCFRRLWRFGQKKPVNSYIILTNIEREILNNVKRKEVEAKTMSKELVKNIEEFERAEIQGLKESTINKKLKHYKGEKWELWEGDCVYAIRDMKENIVDFSIYSPPFVSLYTYTDSPQDMGNSKGWDEFFDHYKFLISELLRVTQPGRNTAVHVSQVPAMLIRDGYIGLKDFRAEISRAYQDKGWIYDGEIVIQKNPQAQAVRTKSKALLFVQLKRDSSWLRPGLADYILKFRKPGENKKPIIPTDITNNQWIKWAHPVWFDIQENNTLNKAEARTDKDEKHICPLQLDVIDRCIRLWSNPKELVLSPFAGIGSEGYQAIIRNRRFYGVELKPEYVKVAIRNLQRAESTVDQLTLFNGRQSCVSESM